jgi:uncharacterized protein (TIGR02996 family)
MISGAVKPIVKTISGVLDGPNSSEWRWLQEGLRILRSAYADWLPRRDAAHWIEIHRMQCELDGLPPRSRKRRQLLDPMGEIDLPSVEEALLRAILANPHDLAGRLVYADWLEERGDSIRAEYFRVECELDALRQKCGKQRLLLTRRLTDLCWQCSSTPSLLYRDWLISVALRLRQSPAWDEGHGDISHGVIRKIGTIALVLARPKWTVAQYAQVLKCSPRTLYRNHLLRADSLKEDRCRNHLLLEAWSLKGDSSPE